MGKGEGESELYGESNMESYNTTCVKQIDNSNLGINP